jgi:hypothetical protein
MEADADIHHLLDLEHLDIHARHDIGKERR